MSKNYLKSWLLAAVLILPAWSAHAFVDLSMTQANVTAQLAQDGSIFFNRTLKLGTGQQPGKGNNYFHDQYAFALTGLFDLSASLSATLTGASGLKIEGYQLFSGAGALLLSSTPIANVADWAQASEIKSVNALGAGNYILEISGFITKKGGTYSGNLAVAQADAAAPPASVPEPASLALMVGALGAMGLVLRRRKGATA